MIKIMKLVVLCLVALNTSLLFSQTTVNPNSIDSVVFTVSQPYFTGEPITNFSVSYLGLEGTQSASYVFTAKFKNESNWNFDNLIFNVKIYLDSPVFSEGEILVYEAQSSIIPLAPGEMKEITSTEFFDRDGGSNDARSYQTLYKFTEKAEAVAVIMSSGKMPSGSTRMVLSLFVQGFGALAKTGQVQYEVVSINELSLNSPGGPFDGLGGDIPDVYSTQPQFSWMSDLTDISYDPNTPLTDKYELNVFKVEPWMTSIDEITQSNPVYVLRTQRSVEQYPASGAQQLEPGRIYCWRVKGLLKGPLNESYLDEEFVSDLFIFKLPDLSQETKTTQENQEVVAQARTILGSQYVYLLDDLDGFSPEAVIYVNGQPVDQDFFAKIIRDLESGKLILRKAEIK